MRVSTKGRYAIRVIIDMAENGEAEFHPLHNHERSIRYSRYY